MHNLPMLTYQHGFSNAKLQIAETQNRKNIDKGKNMCLNNQQQIQTKGIDEEEYILFRMNREKVVGENFRDGSMEVALEL